jgi:hypothetical protein
LIREVNGAQRKLNTLIFWRSLLSKIGRNDPCPCGSGKKYKKCCYKADQLSSSKDEIVRIGPGWVRQNVTRLLEMAVSAGALHSSDTDEISSTDILACHNALTMPASDAISSPDSGSDEEMEIQELGGEAEVEVNIATLGHAKMMSDGGEALEGAELSPVLQLVNLSASNRRDRRLYTQLKLSLSQSVFEPFEVSEVLRGSGFKLKSVLNGRTVQINQSDDAEVLEPMEWLYGRVVIFEKRAYLLEGWEKVGFRRRKALRAAAKDMLSLSDDVAPLSVLRSQASQLLACCRLHELQRPTLDQAPQVPQVTPDSTDATDMGSQSEEVGL